MELGYCIREHTADTFGLDLFQEYYQSELTITRKSDFWDQSLKKYV